MVRTFDGNMRRYVMSSFITIGNNGNAESLDETYLDLSEIRGNYNFRLIRAGMYNINVT